MHSGWSESFPTVYSISPNLHWSVSLIAWSHSQGDITERGKKEKQRNLWCAQTYLKYCFPFMFIRVSGLHRDKTCVLSACVRTLSHAYTHWKKNNFIRIAGLHRDKPWLLILTYWLNTHTLFTFGHTAYKHGLTYTYGTGCVFQTCPVQFTHSERDGSYIIYYFHPVLSFCTCLSLAYDLFSLILFFPAAFLWFEKTLYTPYMWWKDTPIFSDILLSCSSNLTSSHWEDTDKFRHEMYPYLYLAHIRRVWVFPKYQTTYLNQHILV